MNLSWTRWQTYDACHLHYHLAYVQRAPAIKLRLVYLVGSVVHDVIKSWAEEGYPRAFVEQQAVVQFRKTSAGIVFRGKGAYIKSLRRAVQGSVLVENIYRLMEFPEHNVVVEERFKVPFPDSPGDFLVGAIDIYDPVREGVYDLKMSTGSTVSDPRQLLTYVLVEQLSQRRVNHMGFITPFKPQKIVSAPVVEVVMQEHTAAMLSGLQHMNRGVAADPMACSHCFFCGYRGTAHCLISTR